MGVPLLPMPRFYFHLIGTREITDPNGEDLPNTEAGVLHAYAVAKDLARNRTDASIADQAIRILNESGQEVDRVRLRDAIENE